MQTQILDSIPIVYNADELLAKLRVPAARTQEFMHLLAQAEKISRPKALIGVGYIDEKDDTHVIIEGVKFTSRVLRVNLDKAHRVFPFVITGGVELDEWLHTKEDDVLAHFWAEGINEAALHSMLEGVMQYIKETYQPGEISFINPGSLSDWPIEQQRPLFSLIGETREKIGVYLKESLLMVPTKTISGVFFPTEETFASCALCPRENCRGRRVPYDETLYAQKYSLPAD